jgi:hypothetical protein
MLYAKLIPVARPDPDSKTKLPETIRACNGFGFWLEVVNTLLSSNYQENRDTPAAHSK